MNPTQQIHPVRDQLIQFSLGRLDPENAAAIEEHIATCDACCQILRSLPNDTLIDLLQDIGTVSDPGAADRKSDTDSSVPPTRHPLGGAVSEGPGLAVKRTARPGPETASQVGPKTADAIDWADIPPELGDHPRYRILGVLGKGGMGNVYRAEHRLMERQVAIKVIRGQLLDRPEAVERFRREVKTAAQLVHPNIVTAFDAEQAGDRHLLVMEYVDGKDLAREVEQNGPLPVADACRCIRQAATGLEYAFERGMVHRDIKPQNLIRTDRGEVKILDFGLAYLASESMAPNTVPTGHLTDLHTTLGTPDYISPEQTEDAHQADIRSDIYSLGATFYHLLTGQPPFPGGSVIAKLAAHANQEPRSVTEFRDDVPAGVIRTLERMMAKDPKARYQTPAAVAAALLPWSEGREAHKKTPQADADACTIGSVTQSTNTASSTRHLPRWLQRTLTAAVAAVLIYAAYTVIDTRGTTTSPPTSVARMATTDAVQTATDPAIDQDPVTNAPTEHAKPQQHSTGTPGNAPASQEILPGSQKSTLGSQGNSTGTSGTVPAGAEGNPSPMPAALQLAADNFRYYTMPLHEITLTDGLLPEPESRARNAYRFRRLADAVYPYAILDGPGKASVQMDHATWRLRGDAYRNAILAIQVPDDSPAEITGRLLLPSPDWNGLVVRKFKLHRGTLKSDKEAYLRQQLAYYRELFRRNIPGAAWFRYRIHTLETALGQTNSTETDTNDMGRIQGNRNRESEIERSFALLSGGRAVSENLQLDRLLPTTAAADQMVDIDSIQGITVREFDWMDLVEGLEPELDPLARLVPHDQHAIFFPTFQAMIRLIDCAALQGTPILQTIEPYGEDARTQPRYEAQLGLPLSALARSLGPHVIESIAVTGADPYLRTGTDVAILFEPKSNAALHDLIAAQVNLYAKGLPQAKPIQGEVGGVSYQGYCTPDRSLCSYHASIGKMVVVTNSLEQLRRIAAVALGKQIALGSLPEYLFFRDRYRRGGDQESALLMISDPTIRRWCGPRWRIGAARRVQAAAVMADMQARHMDQMVRGDVPATGKSMPEKSPAVGAWSLTPTGVDSELYNTLAFQTPILELNLDRATQAEADMYKRWRDGYQGNWSRFFDPIAVQFHVQPDQLAADLTVMPLIDRSQYRELENVTHGAQIGIEASDLHPESLFHAAISINTDSRTVQQATSFAKQMAPQLQVDPLAWMGETVAFYIDEDPFWADMVASGDDPGQYMSQHWHQIPIALHIEVTSGFKLTAFLASARAWIEQTAPGMTEWESRQYGDEPYVKVGPSKRAASSEDLSEEMAVYYAATKEALVITLNEKMLRRPLDRLRERRQAQAEGTPIPPMGRPWLGDHVGVQVKKEVLEFLSRIFGDDYQQMMQVLAWNNLPILNEWKQRYPDQDPVAIHERYWQRRLICPGGGTYRWNATWQTMESTVYGHPGEPKQGPQLPRSLQNITAGHFGLTFEENGLRARMELEQNPKPAVLDQDE